LKQPTGDDLTNLLAIGDMHLGRPPAAIPDDLHARRQQLGPDIAWSRAVDAAVQHRVDAVLLAGDLVDQERDFFVAYGQLKAGVQKLAASGIRILAVAGNHDTEVLPRLADEIDALELLGRNGQWQTQKVNDITVLGWSFPRAQVRQSPLPDLPALSPDGPLIGLLHCDLDQPDSPYAPVSRRELEAAPVGAWLLGHVHRPDELDGDRPMGYLGSITALRASETGSRGPWLIRIDDQGITADQLTLAPLRYEAMTIDCSDVEDAAMLSERILAAARKQVRSLVAKDIAPTAMGLRLTLAGHSTAAIRIEEAAAELAGDHRSWNEQGVHCFVQRIECRILPRLDLEQLSGRSDPCGLLARRLLALESPDSDEYQRLVRLARQSMATTVGAREFQPLHADPDDAAVAAWLKRAARSALTRLIAQRERAQ